MLLLLKLLELLELLELLLLLLLLLLLHVFITEFWGGASRPRDSMCLLSVIPETVPEKE